VIISNVSEKKKGEKTRLLYLLDGDGRKPATRRKETTAVGLRARWKKKKKCVGGGGRGGGLVEKEKGRSIGVTFIRKRRGALK